MKTKKMKLNKTKEQSANFEINTSGITIEYDICIIGGGVSGMSAAISAAEKNPKDSICIIEKRPRLGTKLLATGNGKCNITNNKCESFNLTEKFLFKHGIMIKEEAEGRMYPKSEQAASVLELLELQMKRLDIHVLLGSTVLSISKNNGISIPLEKEIECIEKETECIEKETECKRKTSGFLLAIEQLGKEKKISCKNLLIASGGKAAPEFGTTGDGYSFARKLGHEIIKLAPVLMPICCEGVEKNLKGVRSKACVTLLKNEQYLAQEKGEVQFTENGLSGICIFNLSRYLKLDDKDISNGKGSFEEAFRQYKIAIDFAPEWKEQELKELLKIRQKNMSGLPAKTILMSLVNTALAEDIINKMMNESRGSKPNIDEITEMQIRTIVEFLKRSIYTITGSKGWKSAQCTAGGISLKEINMETMESKIVEGLYFAGEVLDYDGPCGGYNLQNAWVTGIKAGNSMATAVK